MPFSHPLLIALAVALLCISITQGSSVPADPCPVCSRVIRSVIAFSNANSVTAPVALEKYCKLASLEVDEQRFCYNVDTIKADLNRMFLMKFDETKICKKVNSINPDWCTIKQAKSADNNLKNKEKSTEQVTVKGRGVIYE